MLSPPIRIVFALLVGTVCLILPFTLGHDVRGKFTTEPLSMEKAARFLSGSSHSNNWAVLVCTSRFWFNYRHIANTLSIYRTVKRLGIPDSNIILMMADDMACNPRNPFPARIFNNANRKLNIYGDNIEVDYRGYDVTVENFVRMMTGRLPEGTPPSKRLDTDDKSNILVFMTGHGGDPFLKFQDAEELTSVELADVFEQMWQKRRYNEVLFMVDTCQAATLYADFYSPKILALASSLQGESSYSHHEDPDIGLAVIDRMTHEMLEIFEAETPYTSTTLPTVIQKLTNYERLRSHIGWRTDLFTHRDWRKVKLTEFFGNVRSVILTDGPVLGAGNTEGGPDTPNATVKDTTLRKAFVTRRRYPYAASFVWLLGF